MHRQRHVPSRPVPSPPPRFAHHATPEPDAFPALPTPQAARPRSVACCCCCCWWGRRCSGLAGTYVVVGAGNGSKQHLVVPARQVGPRGGRVDGNRAAAGEHGNFSTEACVFVFVLGSLAWALFILDFAITAFLFVCDINIIRLTRIKSFISRFTIKLCN